MRLSELDFQLVPLAQFFSKTPNLFPRAQWTAHANPILHHKLNTSKAKLLTYPPSVFPHSFLATLIKKSPMLPWLILTLSYPLNVKHIASIVLHTWQGHNVSFKPITLIHYCMVCEFML